MSPEPGTPATCRGCGHGIVWGLWFGPDGAMHEGGWVHVDGGLLCPRGGLAAPDGAGAEEVKA